MAVQKQGMAIYQLSSFRLIACEFIIACFCMLRLLRSWCWSMPLRERQPCTHVHACVNTYTHILPYVHRHAQHEHSTSHTYIIHTYIAHTHINSLTHTTHIHHMHAYIHAHKLTHHRPSITIILPLPLLTHSLTHLLTHSLTFSFTHLCMHIHTHTQTHPPSPLHHSYTSSSLLAFLCSV